MSDIHAPGSRASGSGPAGAQPPGSRSAGAEASGPGPAGSGPWRADATGRPAPDPDAPAPRRGPALFEADDLDGDGADPHAAPPPPDPDAAAPNPAALRALRAADRPMGGLARLFWAGAGGLLSLALGVATWDFVAGLLARNAVLGALATGLAGALALGLAVLALRELAALARLGRVEALRAALERALRDADRPAAAAAVGKLTRLYAGRPELAWALADVKARGPELLDAASLIGHAERALLAPLDAAATRAVAGAARQAAAATALIPLPVVDVLAALAVNVRMIRTVAEIYGGRAGWLGSWRLLRAVAAHLLATGVIALGDDMMGAAVGGGLAAKLSRRFGEGVVNGALTARVGAAAIEVCRPAPFVAAPRPTGRALAAQALRGLFAA